MYEARKLQSLNICPCRFLQIHHQTETALLFK